MRIAAAVLTLALAQLAAAEGRLRTAWSDVTFGH
jgi:hypothetical protein